MVKMAAGGLSGIVLSFLFYLIYQYYIFSKVDSNLQNSLLKYSDFKTDFLSIPIFKDNRVIGYLSFKLVIKISDLNKSSNVLYYINNLFYRNLDKFEQYLSSDTHIEDNIYKIIVPAISKKFGSDSVGEVDILDLAYDKRI